MKYEIKVQHLLKNKAIKFYKKKKENFFFRYSVQYLEEKLNKNTNAIKKRGQFEFLFYLNMIFLFVVHHHLSAIVCSL
jgi:hypothetical protein